jgi:hypothetical protein
MAPYQVPSFEDTYYPIDIIFNQISKEINTPIGLLG